MAIAPLTQIPGSLPLDRTSIENNDRLASLSRSTPTPNNIRSNGGVARRFTAQRSVAAETLQPQTTGRSYSRDPRTDVSGLRTGRRDTAAAQFKPRDPVSLSFEATSNSGATTTRAQATNPGSGTSRVRAAQTNTAQTTAPGTGTTPTAASAKEVLAAFDALLQKALGTKVKLPADMSHADRVKFAAQAVKSLPPAQRSAFLEQAEAIGTSLGFNFGLKKTDAAGKRVPLNDGVAGKLGEGAAQEYAKVASQSPKAPSAKPAAPASVATTATDAAQTAPQTPGTIADTANTTVPTSTPGATAALPDAEAFRALDLQSALATVKNLSAETIAAIVNAVAAGGTTISRAQFDAINPALSAAYKWNGKDTVSAATLTEDLIKLTGTPAASTQTPATPTVAPTADT